MKLLSVLGALCLVTLASAAPTYEYTPVGKVRSDCIHRVSHGTSLKENTHGRLELHDSHGTPLGTLIPKCENQHLHPLFEPKHHAQKRVYLQERNTHDAADTEMEIHFPSNYDGWTAYTAYNNSEGITTYNGYFSVPDIPDYQPYMLYIFTGLQNIDWIPKHDPQPNTPFDIIQPVLQFPSDEGAGWSIKSWYVTLDEGAIQTEEVLVSPGDLIYGLMEQINSTAWFINSLDYNTGNSTSLTVSRPRLEKQFWAYNTLECYGCLDCTTYPIQPSKFSELLMFNGREQLSPNWALNPKTPLSHFCNETIDQITPVSQQIVFVTATAP